MGMEPAKWEWVVVVSDAIRGPHWGSERKVRGNGKRDNQGMDVRMTYPNVMREELSVR